ncbi:DUF6966 domain-containing protein [Pseudomonas sp. KU43P]|uniref:DUF6966 domain-containing protein n=1 Tax=Pseudomonas sp. KU43P TaxID=2487887 RepID=UPI0012A92050|nr:hypothetical protein [Pseudomonas sp. KU43P]BBH46030.1 hypothetical protein KU43P_25070 [Pseudomonas sp. KU43P]
MTTPALKFNDTFTSREYRFSLGYEASSNRRYLSIPVSNGRVDYEEYYAIEDDRFEAWLREPSAAVPMVVRCRRREMDPALMMQPGADRGSADGRLSLAEVGVVLGRIAQLLRHGGCSDWADAIERCRSRLSSDREPVRDGIRGMHGGMGSISDQVLYRDGALLVEATDELHELLGWVYEWGA